jgi:TPR repeat protein
MSASAARILALLLCLAVAPAAAQDKKEALNVEDLKLRADTGDRTATRQLAEAYYMGRDGVEQNFAEAAKWYEKLAKQGDVRAQSTIGLMYLRGFGVPKDPQAAQRWWRFAAAANDAGAQYNLGTLYLTGMGVRQDYGEAARWYRQAAQRGHLQAQHDLGMLYHNGQGVEKDPRWAYYWVKIAALQGDEKAEENLKVVSKGMSAEDIREGERQAEEWMRKLKKTFK